MNKFLTPTGAIDHAKVAAAIAAGYRDQLSFINRYSGAPRQFWQKQIRAQVTERVARLAHEEQHAFVMARYPYATPMTAAESRRVAELEWSEGLTVSTDIGFLAKRDAARSELAGIRARAAIRCTENIKDTIARAESQRRKEAA